MNIAKYTTTVEASQYTPENHDAIASWAEDHGAVLRRHKEPLVGGEVTLESEDGLVFVPAGTWLVARPNWGIEAITPAKFAERYSPA